MKISFINMIADFAELAGTSIDDVSQGIGMDHRIGASFLQAGIGYGGSCFPKDIQAFRAMGEQRNLPLPLLDATESINRDRPDRLVEKLIRASGTLKGKRIALLGLTFKPMTDDLREAPSLAFCRLCLEHGADVHAYDPFVREYPVKEVVLHRDLYETIDSSDALIFLTEWKQLQDMDWQLVSHKLRYRLVIDGRNMFTQANMQQIADMYDLTYISIGRPTIYPTKVMQVTDLK